MKAPHVCILQTSFAKREDTIAFLKEKVPGVRMEFITDSTLLNDVRAGMDGSRPVSQALPGLNLLRSRIRNPETARRKPGGRGRTGTFAV